MVQAMAALGPSSAVPAPSAKPARFQKGIQRGWPHPALDEQTLKGREVAILLGLHMADRLAIGAAAKHRELPLIDPLGAELTGMVDPDHPLYQLFARQVAGQAVLGGLFGHVAAPSRSFCRFLSNAIPAALQRAKTAMAAEISIL
jgi:hypothetical protein